VRSETLTVTVAIIPPLSVLFISEIYSILIGLSSQKEKGSGESIEGLKDFCLKNKRWLKAGSKTNVFTSTSRLYVDFMVTLT
jgi:hypothetical protein